MLKFVFITIISFVEILEMEVQPAVTQAELKEERQLKKLDCINNNNGAANVKEQNGFKQIFSNFSSNTTAHGFGQIDSTANISLKFIWMAIMIGCVVLFCTQVIPLLIKFLRKPTTTTISLVDQREVVFPSVVICNENPIKSAKYNDLLQIIKSNNINVDNLVFDTPNQRFEYIMAAAVASITNRNNITMYGHTREETIKECFFKYHVQCNNVTFWTDFWHWKLGTCSTFNSGYDNNWKKQQLLKVKRIGPYNGLELTVFLNQSQYLNITKSAGVTLFIGNPGVYFAVLSDGIKLSPGFSYTVVMRKTAIRRADPFKNGSCLQDEITQLSGNPVGQREVKKYSRELCDFLCLAEAQLKSCDCIEFWLPKIKKYDNVTVCLNDKCASKILKEWDDNLIPCSSSCTPPCNEDKYNLRTSMQQYPTMVQRKKAREGNNSRLETDYLTILIYFQTMQEEMTVDSVSYKIEDLLGDIGGQMGLFIGCSVLTLIEFIYLFFHLVGYIAKKLFIKC